MRQLPARWPSPGTVLGVFALIVALGGVAIAAIPGRAGVISACYQTKSGAVRVIDTAKRQKCRKGEKAVSWNQNGPRGAQGAQGVPGAAGAAGAAGSNGAGGADGFSGGMSQTVVIGGVTRFVPLVGGQQQPNEENGTAISPNRELVLKDFGVEVTGGLAGSETVTATLRVENVDTAVTCSITNPATTCSSAAQVTIAARSRVSVKVANTAVGNPALAWSFTLEKP